jgi:hypothetical protein
MSECALKLLHVKQGKPPDIFVVNSFGSGFQVSCAFNVFVTILSNI